MHAGFGSNLIDYRLNRSACKGNSNPFVPIEPNQRGKRAKLNKLGPKLISKIFMAEKYTLTPLHAYFICVKRIYQSKVMHISRFETKSGNRFKADRKNVKLRSNRKTFTIASLVILIVLV